MTSNFENWRYSMRHVKGPTAKICNVWMLGDITTTWTNCHNIHNPIRVHRCASRCSILHPLTLCLGRCEWHRLSQIWRWALSRAAYYICACSTATIDQITRWMARWDSAHQIGPVHGSKDLADCSWSTSKVALAWSQIPKIEDICACSAATIDWIARKMARWDSAH